MMKLSKGKFQTILILAIVLAAYLLLAFVIPFAKTAVFWLALVFTLAAFGVQLYVLKLSFTRARMRAANSTVSQSRVLVSCI